MILAGCGDDLSTHPDGRYGRQNADPCHHYRLAVPRPVSGRVRVLKVLLEQVHLHAKSDGVNVTQILLVLELLGLTPLAMTQLDVDTPLAPVGLLGLLDSFVGGEELPVVGDSLSLEHGLDAEALGLVVAHGLVTVLGAHGGRPEQHDS